MKLFRILLPALAGVAILSLPAVTVLASHNEYRVTPTSVSEAGGSVRITVSIGCTNPRDTKYQTLDGTAQNGRDYTAVSGQFAVSSSTPRTFDLPVLNDNSTEPEETIELLLEGPGDSGGVGSDQQGACIGTPSHRVTLSIHDDDPARGPASPGSTATPSQGIRPSPEETSELTPLTPGPTDQETTILEDSGLQTTQVQEDGAPLIPEWALVFAGLLVGAGIVALIWFWRQRQQQPGEKTPL